ncbi:hypothetical protein WN51_05624 [Melipona quadrifasciata]|uniref:Uncharacterized protein n=1 Tax=Melipona quadrifasciata TaxID=166423 RepID=A0A0N0BDB9_9HYME|nr:hypothetical protein WN51_05624 [Melipona quadrifasciata]
MVESRRMARSQRMSAQRNKNTKKVQFGDLIKRGKGTVQQMKVPSTPADNNRITGNIKMTENNLFGLKFEYKSAGVSDTEAYHIMPLENKFSYNILKLLEDRESVIVLDSDSKMEKRSNIQRPVSGEQLKKGNSYGWSHVMVRNKFPAQVVKEALHLEEDHSSYASKQEMQRKRCKRGYRKRRCRGRRCRNVDEVPTPLFP